MQQHLWLQVISVIVLTLSYSGLVVHGQVCSSDDITADEWEWGIINEKIDLSFRGTLAEYRMNNTVSISTESSGFSRKYIDAVLEDGVLRIFTTEDFANYEDQETALQIQLRITFVCTTPSTTRIVFYQGLNSANNHPPVFSESEYTIPVKLPLPRGFDLTFFEEVLARDIDLEHNQVTFHSPSSSFIDVGTSDRIGDDKKTFFATLVLNQQLLTLAQNFSFTIIATDSGVDRTLAATAQVYIVADEEATYIPSPRFEKPIYRGDISEAGEFSSEIPTIEEDTYSDALTYTISGDDGHLFLVEASEAPFSVSVTLRAPLTEENLIGKTFFTATISANHPEVASGSTVLLIDLPNVPVITTPKPAFEKSLVRGSINAELELIVETIVLTTSSFTADTTFSLSGDDSSAFTLTNEQNVATITLTDPLTEEELLTRSFYSFVVAATNPVSGVAETAVLIALPPKTCEDCPVCPEPPDCPECPEDPETTVCPECTTPAPIPPTVDISPKFQNQFYSFTIKSNEFDKIGDVFATSLDADATIEYSITTENAYLMSKLSIGSSTGEIFLQEEINSGNYEAEVTAKITVDDEVLQSSSVIKLTVLLAITCPDGNTTVEKSLAIQYLRENEIHRNMFPSKIENCTYAIRSIHPNDKEYVTINPVTNMLDSISFDREDSIFDEYEVPQIQIRLKLNCDDDSPTSRLERYQEPYSLQATQSHSSRSIDPSIGDGRWYTLINDIDFASDLTVINIIIEDVNDNYPKFDPSTPSFVGYPDTEIANRIIPAHLVVIHATDIDAGINAKIRCSLADNNYFQIHPDSGIITPLSDGWSNVNSVELMIYATDNYGAQIGLSVSHALYVRKLEEQHLTVVTLRDNNLNSTADEVIEQLNAESSIKMLVLHSALVPYLPIDSRRSRQDSPSNALRMIVYALDDNGQPLGTTQVQRQLESFVNVRQLTFSSYDSHSSDDDDDDDEFEVTVWIVVVSVMGGIILLSVVALFLMWWFKIRPYEYKTMIDETATSQTNLQADPTTFNAVESSPPMSRFESEKRESVNISGSTDRESTDEPTKRAVLLLNLLNGDEDADTVSQEDPFGEESERREREKSQGVTFNELVERIDIETDPVRDSDTDLRS